MKKDQLKLLLDAQQSIIANIALSSDLETCLTSMCLSIERVLDTPDAMSSILLNGDGKLTRGAAPNLPVAYSEAIEGMDIGPNVGSCGTAMFTKEQVIVSNIQKDERWAGYEDFAESFDLRACWSNPIFSTHGEVLGSFAIYYKRPMRPSSLHLELIERFTNLASLAIEHHQKNQRENSLKSKLQHTVSQLQAFSQVVPDLTLVVEKNGTIIQRFGNVDKIPEALKSLEVSTSVESYFDAETLTVLKEFGFNALNKNGVEYLEHSVSFQGTEIELETRIAPLKWQDADGVDLQCTIWFLRDISEKKRYQKEIEKLAFYDVLTGLPNRRLLLEQLSQAIEKARRESKYGSVLYLDLNDFKRVNDSLGHSVGDELLVEVSHRIRYTLRSVDRLVRVGGDEFVVLLDLYETELNEILFITEKIAKKIISCFDESFELGNNEFRLGVSIGISIINGDESSVDDVLMRADAAMYRAKQESGSNFMYFDVELQSMIRRRMELESDILNAIRRKEFTVKLQPIFNSVEKIHSAEALIRWEHPEKGAIPPDEFISHAEDLGHIHVIQNLVVEQVCEIINHLEQRQLIPPEFSVSINISAKQFEMPSFISKLLEILNAYSVSPARINLELTESTLIRDVTFACDQISELRNHGFKVSIDDFGTGYSSLMYLHEFEFDQLKVDKSFVHSIGHNAKSLAIIEVISALAMSLHFELVAEGVETRKQRDYLVKRGVKLYQGHFYSMPMTIDELVEVLEKHFTATPLNQHASS